MSRLCQAISLSHFVLAGLVGGCGDEPSRTDESGEAADIVEPIPEPVVEPPPSPDRGPDGALLPSDMFVGGLQLPRGLRRVAVDGRSHYFEGSYVPELYVDYIGRRVFTGTVERLEGGGARYVEATARNARGSAVVMDILISPGAAGTTVMTIHERPPAPENPPTEAEAFEALRRELERASR